MRKKKSDDLVAPIISESGGGYTSRGWARIICGREGERLRPKFVPKRQLSFGGHADFEASPGLVIIEARRDGASISIMIRRIAAIEGNTLLTVDVASWADGNGRIPPAFADAVQAAIEKTLCYRCRHAHYMLSE